MSISLDELDTLIETLVCGENSTEIGMGALEESIGIGGISPTYRTSLKLSVTSNSVLTGALYRSVCSLE